MNSSFEYIGSFDDLSKSQLELIGEVLEKKGFKKCKVLIDQVGQAGDNFVATIKRITANDANGKRFKMIAKVAPTNENARMKSNTHNLFLNEVIMYTEVLPKFKQIQLSSDVPKSEMLRYTECYGSITESPYEFILLEDLKESNYVILDRFDYLSKDSVKLLLKNVAILHSLSYALKHKHPEKFSDVASKLFDVWSSVVEGDTKGFISLLETQTIELMSDNDRRMEITKSAKISEMNKLVKKLSNADVGSRHTVLLQGDIWTSNIMFKFEGKTLQDLVMIDYQLSKEGSPVLDILYFLFNCTEPQMRLEQFNDWIDYYHAELDKALSNYGLKTSAVYPRDKLDADLKRYGKLVFAICIITASILTMSTENAAKMKDEMRTLGIEGTEAMTSTLENNDSKKLFKLRVEGMVDTLLQYGLV